MHLIEFVKRRLSNSLTWVQFSLSKQRSYLAKANFFICNSLQSSTNFLKQLSKWSSEGGSDERSFVTRNRTVRGPVSTKQSPSFHLCLLRRVNKPYVSHNDRLRPVKFRSLGKQTTIGTSGGLLRISWSELVNISSVKTMKRWKKGCEVHLW